MNTKIVYIAGIALLMVGIAFYIINSGFFSSDNSISSLNKNNSKTTPVTVKPSPFQISSSSSSNSNIAASGQQSQQKQKQISSDYENLTVSARYVNVSQINNIPFVLVALDVHNPNRGAAILDTLSYSVFFNNVRLASADIGIKPQGFIDSLSSVYPIIGNQTITLKDKQPLTPEGSSALFNSNGTLIHNSNSNITKTPGTPNSYFINGTFSTTLARGTQSQNSETPFSLQFLVK